MNQLPRATNGRLLIVAAAGLGVFKFKSEKIVGPIKVGFSNRATDLVRAVQPTAQIDQFAAFRTERAKRAGRGRVQRLRFAADGTAGRVDHE